MLGIFGGIGSVPKRISGTPLFAEAASAAAATGTTFIELCRTGTPEAVAAALRSGADVNTKNEKKRKSLDSLSCFNFKDPSPSLLIPTRYLSRELGRGAGRDGCVS